MQLTKRNITIAFTILLVVVLVLGILYATGVLTRSGLKKLLTGVEEPPDIKLMSSRNAYDIALLRAQQWQPDAKMTDSKSLPGTTGPSGRSDNWDLIFVSDKVKKRGFHIIIQNRQIATAEEINFVGKGNDLPENIVSSQEAVARMHQIKGYENEQVISVEMLYGPDGKVWYWGVKTAKGVITIKATK